MLFAVLNPRLLFPSLLMTLKVILKLQVWFNFFRAAAHMSTGGRRGNWAGRF